MDTIMVGCTRRASRIVVVLMEEATAGLCTLWDTVRVGVGINGETGGIAFEKGFIANCPANDFDRNIGIREAIIS
jgi:hypothetical protein